MCMNLRGQICIQFSYLIGQMYGDGAFCEFYHKICIENETNKNV